MKNFLIILTLMLTVGIFSSCEKCETCSLNIAFVDAATESVIDALAVAEGYADFQDLAEEALVDEEGVPIGEVCGDAIDAAKDDFADAIDGESSVDIDGDGLIDVSYSYTCE